MNQKQEIPILILQILELCDEHKDVRKMRADFKACYPETEMADFGKAWTDIRKQWKLVKFANGNIELTLAGRRELAKYQESQEADATVDKADDPVEPLRELAEERVEETEPEEEPMTDNDKPSRGRPPVSKLTFNPLELRPMIEAYRDRVLGSPEEPLDTAIRMLLRKALRDEE